MDLFEAIRTRRSIRKFHPDRVPDDDVRQILEAARLAPSSSNLQPWRFIVIRDRECILSLAKAVNDVFDQRIVANPEEERRLVESNVRFFSTHFGEAPLVIVALVQGQLKGDPAELIVEPADLQSVAAAVQNLLLAATALGYGTCWMTGPIETARTEIETILGIERSWVPMALIPVGRIAYHPRPRPCKSLAEIAVFVGPSLAEEETEGE